MGGGGGYMQRKQHVFSSRHGDYRENNAQIRPLSLSHRIKKRVFEFATQSFYFYFILFLKE